MTRFLLLAVLAALPACGCSIAPPPMQENPTIEKSAPEKPKPIVQIEKELREEFKKPAAPPPER